MKKLLILLLCLSLITACFIGCDSEGRKLDNEEFSSFESTTVTSSETSAETSEETATENIESENEMTINTVDGNMTDTTESEETEKETEAE